MAVRKKRSEQQEEKPKPKRQATKPKKIVQIVHAETPAIPGEPTLCVLTEDSNVYAYNGTASWIQLSPINKDTVVTDLELDDEDEGDEDEDDFEED